MIWNRQLHAFIPRNPIVIHELRHQKRTTTFIRGFVESVGIVAVALCFSAAMLVYVAHHLNPWKWGASYTDGIQVLAWTFHSIAALRVIFAGFLIIRRQDYSLGSEDLMLTPLNWWQLFSGKWWAAIHHVRGWMLALGIVQFGIVVSTVFGLMMTINWSMTCLTPCIITIRGLAQPFWFAPLRSMFILASAVGIAVLETMCCTALGIATAILVRSTPGVLVAIALRFAPVVIFSFFPDYPWASVYFMQRFSEYTWFSFADGGTGAIMLLVQPIGIWGTYFVQRPILSLCAVVSMFLIYLSLSLLVVWAVSQRSRR